MLVLHDDLTVDHLLDLRQEIQFQVPVHEVREHLIRRVQRFLNGHVHSPSAKKQAGR